MQKVLEDNSQIIDQLKAGSKEAFRSLFDEFGPKIHSFALSYLKNKADAEELLQDVFLKLWEVRGSLDNSKNIKAFLFKISINLIYDFIRRKNIENAYLDYSGNNQLISENTWNEVVYNDMLNSVNHLVALMPEQRQRIFRLSKQDGFSNDEIAKQLNLSRRTIENQLYRAVSYLKDNLGTGTLTVLLFLLFQAT